MAMNYEFERHIEAARAKHNEKGVTALKSIQTLFETLALEGIVPILQQESKIPIKEKTVRGPGLNSFVIPNNVEFENFSFGQAVVYFRIQRNLSQKELAYKAGNLSQSYMSEIEHGKFFASRKTWINILKVLSVGEEDPAIELLERKRAEELIKRKAENKAEA